MVSKFELIFFYFHYLELCLTFKMTEIWRGNFVIHKRKIAMEIEIICYKNLSYEKLVKRIGIRLISHDKK